MSTVKMLSDFLPNNSLSQRIIPDAAVLVICDKAFPSVRDSKSELTDKTVNVRNSNIDSAVQTLCSDLSCH